jgi:glycosyl transferase, family 25
LPIIEVTAIFGEVVPLTISSIYFLCWSMCRHCSECGVKFGPCFDRNQESRENEQPATRLLRPCGDHSPAGSHRPILAFGARACRSRHCNDRPKGQNDTNGFPSRGVYGNSLSHLDILRRAAKDDLQAAWVLEDDAIFRSSFRRFDVQKKMCDQLAMASWDLCFLGHTISKELSDRPVGLIPCELSFRWSHCYLVNKRFIPELVKYLEATLERPAGHPEGGRLFIDGAFNLIRELRPEIRTLVFNPTLSIQAGSQSSLNPEIWYDGIQSLHWLAERSRSVRDDIWRRTGFHWPGHEIRR